MNTAAWGGGAFYERSEAVKNHRQKKLFYLSLAIKNKKVEFGQKKGSLALKRK
jgi:hypothetical protein